MFLCSLINNLSETLIIIAGLPFKVLIEMFNDFPWFYANKFDIHVKQDLHEMKQ